MTMKRRIKRRRSRRNAGRIKKSVLIPLLLLAVAMLLMAASVYIDGFADWYAVWFYPVSAGAFGRVFGLVPTSVAEIGLYLTVIIFVLGMLYIILSLIHKNWNRFRTKRAAKVLLWTVSVLAFLYVVNCGVNYRATSFAERSGIQPREYSVEELRNVCLWLAQKVQETEPQITRDSDGEMIFSTDAGKNAVRAMQELGEDYRELKGYYPQPKTLIVPAFLSVQSLTGIYSPFTVEANYNSDMTAYNIPFTMCHELSHLKGFMQEQEANFIAWLACSRAATPEFRYSAALSGWLYASNQLWKYDPSSYEELYGMLPENARRDLAANDAFWAKYEGKIAEVSNQINDAYLKSNGQEQGVKSYDKMVDMLVVYVLDILAE